MDKPTPSEIRIDTRIQWVTLGYPATTEGDALMSMEIDDAWAYIAEAACLDLDGLDGSSSKGRLALRAIKLRLMQQSIQGQSGFINGQVNNNVKSFAVPGYSETKFDPPGEIKSIYNMINPWPLLSDLLWKLMSDECRERWRESMTDENPPAESISEVSWLDYAGYIGRLRP